MSKIPFNFQHLPTYFREHGWFKKPNCVAFVTWAFSRCSNEQREIAHDYQNIILKPYQFIFGRRICSEETGLTEMEVRIQVNSMIKAGFVKKATNKTTNRYTIYEWVTTCFSENNNQQNNQQTTNRQPTDNHNQDHRSLDLIDYDLIDNACARNKKKEAEIEKQKIPETPNQTETIEPDESRLIVCQKRNGGITSIRLNKLNQELDIAGFTPEEIAEGIAAFEEKDRSINGTIAKYITTIINNQRLKKLREAEQKKIQEDLNHERNQRSPKFPPRKTNQESAKHPRRYSEQDYFEWTRNATQKSSVRYPTEV